MMATLASYEGMYGPYHPQTLAMTTVLAVALCDSGSRVHGRRLLFVGAARAGKLTVARVDDAGQPAVVAAGDTPHGARNPVADAQGNAYEADPANGGVLVFAHAP